MAWWLETETRQKRAKRAGFVGWDGGQDGGWRGVEWRKGLGWCKDRWVSECLQGVSSNLVNL